MDAPNKRAVLRSAVSPKLKRTNRILRILLLIMGVIVVYDSLVHAPPLYYMLFFLLGRIAGVVFRLFFSVNWQNDEGFEIRANQWNILLSVLLLSLHFYWGEMLLEQMKVIWAKDAIYLFFMGLYLTKLRYIGRQIDEYVYAMLRKKGRNPQ